MKKLCELVTIEAIPWGLGKAFFGNWRLRSPRYGLFKSGIIEAR